VAGSYYGQSYQILGGGRALADAFEEALREAGVAMFTGHGASAIHLNDAGAFESISLEDINESLTADACVFSGDPRLLLDLLPEKAFRPIYRKRLQGMRDTMSAFILFGVLPEQSAGFSGHLVLMKNVTPGMGSLDAPPHDRPVFITRSCAPHGRGGVSVICPMRSMANGAWERLLADGGDDAYREWKEKTAASVRAGLEGQMPSGFTDFRLLDAATPRTFRRYCNSVAGALYGAGHRMDDMPLLPRTRVPGLFLTGQHTLTVGVLGAVMSGYVTAEMLQAQIG